MGLVSFLLVSSLIVNEARAQPMDSRSRRLLQSSLTWAQEGQMGRALKGFREINKKYPGQPLIQFNLANSAFMVKKYSLAIKYYLKVHKSSSPLKYPARIYLVRAYARVAKIEKAYRLLKKLRVKKGFTGLNRELKISREILHDEIVLQGIEEFKRRNYKEASMKFRRANGLSNSGESLYLLGLSERRRGLTKRSRYFLRKARSSYDSSDNVQDIDSIIANIERSQKRQGNRLQLSIEQMYNSNFYTEKADPSGVSGQTVLASYSHFNQTSKGLLYAGVFSLNGEFFSQLDGQDYADIDIRAPVVIPLGLVDLNLTPKLNYSLFDYDPYVLRTGLFSHTIRTFTQASLGFIVNYDLITAQNNEFDYLGGRELFVGTSLRVPAKVTAYFQGGYRDTEAGTFDGDGFEIPQAYEGFEFEGSGTFTFEKAYIRSGLRYSLYRFKSNFFPEDKVRRDTNLDFYTNIDFQIDYDASISFNVSYRDRSSTMVSSVGIDSNFVRWKFGASFNWGIDL